MLPYLTYSCHSIHDVMNDMTMRSILHIDMDAYFASIEQRDNPAYRGKAVIVGADPKGGTGRGVVSAASYEAREHGIHSAMPIGQAYRQCSDGIFLPVRMERYYEVSERIFEIFHRYTDLVEPLSVDEAFLDVTGSYALFGSPETIGRRIQEKILKEEQLHASVGVASNKFVAKVASDLEKPQGFVLVPGMKEREFLRDLPISRLWGVGPKTSRRLNELGYQKIGDITRHSQALLRSRLGKLGVHVWQLSHGLDDRPVVSETHAKSIGAETTFSRDTNSLSLIQQTLLALSERVAQRLRAEQLDARALTLKFRNESFETVTRSQVLLAPTDQATDLYAVSLKLLTKVPPTKQKVRLLGLSASQLTSSVAYEQLALFESVPQRNTQLSHAVDAVRQRFGDDVIQLGSLVERRNA